MAQGGWGKETGGERLRHLEEQTEGCSARLEGKMLHWTTSEPSESCERKGHSPAWQSDSRCLARACPALWLLLVLPLMLQDGEHQRVPPASLKKLVLSQVSFQPHAELLQYPRRSDIVGDTP